MVIYLYEGVYNKFKWKCSFCRGKATLSMGEVINFVFDDANEEPAVDLSKSNVEFENNLTNNADGTATIFIV